MDNRSMAAPAAHVLYIAAPRERLWSTLIDPEAMRAYFFGRRIESTFEAGAAMRVLMPDGSVDASGRVLEIDPPRLMRMSWEIERLRGVVPASVVSFEMEPFGEMCRLTMTETFPAPVAEPLVEGSRRIWPLVLSSLKSLVETGRAPEVDLVKLMQEAD